MAARTPEELHRQWGERFSAGDLDGLVSLYEPDAVLLAELGSQPLRGQAAIREAWRGFLGAQADFELKETNVLEAGDVAVVYSKWTLTGGTGPDGSPLDLSGETTDVVRRQQDGGWLFLIDNPWGVAG